MSAETIATIRDVVIIAWGVLGIIAFLVLIFVALAIFRAVKPILTSAKVITGNAATTSTLITNVVARPLIRVASFYTGVRQGFKTVSRFRRKKP